MYYKLSYNENGKIIHQSGIPIINVIPPKNRKFIKHKSYPVNIVIAYPPNSNPYLLYGSFDKISNSYISLNQIKINSEDTIITCFIKPISKGYLTWKFEYIYSLEGEADTITFLIDTEFE